MIYRVLIDETYSGVVFDFDVLEDAIAFTKSVVDAGHRETERLKATITVILEEADNE